MPTPIKILKTTIKEWIDAIQAGEPLAPPDGCWDRCAAQAAAGALMFAAASHGPMRLKDDGDFFLQLPKEHLEAHEETLKEEIEAAIRFHAMLTQAVVDDEYDVDWEYEIIAAAIPSEDGIQIYPVKGFLNE